MTSSKSKPLIVAVLILSLLAVLCGHPASADTAYTDVSTPEEFADALADGATDFRLTGDMGTALTVDTGGRISIDLNGHSLNGLTVADGMAYVTVLGSGAVGGDVTAEYGQLQILGGDYSGTVAALHDGDHVSTVVIEDGTFADVLGAMNVTGGTFSGEVVSVLVSGGTFRSTVSSTNISAGTFEGTVSNAGTVTGGIFGSDTVSAAIGGGTFNGKTEAGTITGGTFNSDVKAANISGGTFTSGVDCGHVTGGTFSDGTEDVKIHSDDAPGIFYVGARAVSRILAAVPGESYTVDRDGTVDLPLPVPGVRVTVGCEYTTFDTGTAAGITLGTGGFVYQMEGVSLSRETDALMGNDLDFDWDPDMRMYAMSGKLGRDAGSGPDWLGTDHYGLSLEFGPETVDLPMNDLGYGSTSRIVGCVSEGTEYRTVFEMTEVGYQVTDDASFMELSEQKTAYLGYDFVLNSANRAKNAVVELDGHTLTMPHGMYFGGNVTVRDGGDTLEILGGYAEGLGDGFVIGPGLSLEGGIFIIYPQKYSMTGDITLSGDLTVLGCLELRGGSSLTVPADTVLYLREEPSLGYDQHALVDAGSCLTVHGQVLADIPVSVSGTVYIEPGADADFVREADRREHVASVLTLDSFGIRGTLEKDTEVGTAHLTGDLTVPEGMTLTVSRNLELNHFRLTVQGRLVIADGGSTTSNLDMGSILLGGGSISNNGTLCAADTVPVVAGRTLAFVSQLTGGEFSDTVVNGTDTLCISGEVSGRHAGSVLDTEETLFGDLEIRTFGDSGTLRLNGTVSSSLLIGKSVSGIVSLRMDSGSVLTVDGNISGGVSLVAGSTAICNGYADCRFVSPTGTFETFGPDGSRVDPADGCDGRSYVQTSGLGSFKVSSEVRYRDCGGVRTTSVSLGIAGTPVSADGVSASIKVSGEATVPEGSGLRIPDGTSADTSGGVFVAYGRLVTGPGLSIDYRGTAYTEKAGDTSVKVYTGFYDALASSVGSEDGVFTLKGGMSFDRDFVLADGQTVCADDCGPEHPYSIETGVTAVLEDGSSFIRCLGTVDGLLKVMDGAHCTPPEGSYQAYYVFDGGTVYAGAASALENTVSGDKLYIVGDAELADKAFVAEGVSVTVVPGCTLKADVLQVSGMLSVDGRLEVTGELRVSGEVHVEGVLDGSGAVLDIDGRLTCVSEYCMEGDPELECFAYRTPEYLCMTDLGSALEAASLPEGPTEIVQYGNHSVPGDHTVPGSADLVIMGDLKTGSLTLDGGAGVHLRGGSSFTGDIAGLYGASAESGTVRLHADRMAGDATSELEVKVSYSEMRDSYSTEVRGYVLGGLALLYGELTIPSGNPADLSGDMSLSTSPGSVLRMGSSLIGGDSGSLTNGGTVVFSGDGIAAEGVTLTGRTVITDGTELSVSGCVFAGELTTEGDGRLLLAGNCTVGVFSDTLGSAAVLAADIVPGDGVWLTVSPGSEVTDTSVGPEAFRTAYLVNGIPAGSVMTWSDDVPLSVFDTVVAGFDDLDASAPVAWSYGGTAVEDGHVGEYSEVSSLLDYRSAEVILSVAPGMSVYIDSLRADGPSAFLRIGMHSVQVYLDPGYSGTPSIEFAGTTVTDGSLTVTYDMVADSPMLKVTGAEPYVPPEPLPPEPPLPPVVPEDGGGITDILLAVLAVAVSAAVLAVAVSMRRV